MWGYTQIHRESRKATEDLLNAFTWSLPSNGLLRGSFLTALFWLSGVTEDTHRQQGDLTSLLLLFFKIMNIG
jgi:hypothetical protein